MTNRFPRWVFGLVVIVRHVFVPALVFGALVSKDFRLGEYLSLLFATGDHLSRSTGGCGHL